MWSLGVLSPNEIVLCVLATAYYTLYTLLYTPVGVLSGILAGLFIGERQKEDIIYESNELDDWPITPIPPKQDYTIVYEDLDDHEIYPDLRISVTGREVDYIW